MHIAHAPAMEWRQVSGHRTGDITFKRLLQGTPGAPDNFEFSLVRTIGHYHTPRHRHNFDQVRFGVLGKANYAPGKDVEPGTVAYFPEGAYYGPQDPEGETVSLVLQSGGPSGQGFMSYDELHAGHVEMQKLGSFEQGVFRRNPGANLPGTRKNQDSYEAIWEYKQGRPLVYPKPLYDEPIMMRLDAYEWRHDPAQPGIARKTLGTFTDRAVTFGLVRIDAGATLRLDAWPAVRLVYVVAGKGRCGDAHWAAESAIKLDRDEVATLAAEVESELFTIGLPVFEEPVTVRRDAAA